MLGFQPVVTPEMDAYAFAVTCVEILGQWY